MRKMQPALRRMGRHDKSLATLAQQLGNQRIFPHREAVAIRHAVGVIIGMVDDRQGHGFRSEPVRAIVKRSGEP